MINHYIKEIIELSNNYDQKNPSQKLLKLVEEVGELSQAFLIENNAHGTQFRDKSQYSTKEEMADIYLCLISLLPMLKIEEKDFFDEVAKKMEKWKNKVAHKHELNSAELSNIINTDLVPIGVGDCTFFTSKSMQDAYAKMTNFKPEEPIPEPPRFQQSKSWFKRFWSKK